MEYVQLWCARGYVRAALVALFCVFCVPTLARAQAPLSLTETPTQPGVVVFPAQSNTPRGITVVLHGMCGEPERTCAHFAAAVTEHTHLICPRAPRRCAGGAGSTWPDSGFDQHIERAIARAEVALAGRVDPGASRTLIGYSLGAFRALALAENARGRYPHVLLIGARISANAKKLRAHGVQRLLLAAGSWDITHAHMRREAIRLKGFEPNTQFIDLGPVGHALTPSFGSQLARALTWLWLPPPVALRAPTSPKSVLALWAARGWGREVDT